MIIKTIIAIFDNLDLRKHYVEIDYQRYPRDSLLINYEENSYVQHCKDSNLFFKEYIEEQLLNLSISYSDLKTKYPIEKKVKRHQLDPKTPKKFNYFKNTALILTMLDCLLY